jgi:hypothetical protein
MDAADLRWLDVILRRPRPDDERERKSQEIAELEVKFEETDNRIRRMVDKWRRR